MRFGRNLFATTNARVIGAFCVAALLHAVGTALIPGYSTPFAVRAMLVLASLLAVASIGQTLVVIMGGIDLSIPSSSASPMSWRRSSMATAGTFFSCAASSACWRSLSAG
ncbi:hypothetical protein [Mesorhizobium sp. STM 4661]|uniref:hypothetical protein n=1 Tax=Mesorhizobium sp. STM 4661 TaxID=1297570 RepID=UPI0002BDBC77|nr:hypothetical protein [Mesorhizobium sp. STM 4661]CCV12024.1 exported hypothetical protein [Mesorhizobium sp. STM 4661]